MRRLLFKVGRQERRKRSRKRSWERLDKPLAFATLRERYIVRSDDQVIGRKVYVRGEYDFHKFVEVRLLLGERDFHTVIDVGANIGSICIPAVVRNFARFAHAFEPEPRSFALLDFNCRWNGVEKQIECYPFALSRQNGFSGLSYPSTRNFGDVRLSEEISGTFGVRTQRFDDLDIELNPTTDLIWMDVQGHELAVLEGMSAQLNRRVPLVMEFWPHELAKMGGSVESLSRLLAGYRFYWDLGKPDEGWKPIGDIRSTWLVLEESPDGATDLLFR